MSSVRRYYSGIGSRQTPPHILEAMTHFATNAETYNWALRSGAAEGADSAFEAGISNSGMKAIYLPWGKYNGSNSIEIKPLDKAYDIAAKFHPTWDDLAPGAKKLMARNVHIILGRFCDSPSHFVICWTPEGKVVGGTGHSLRIAEAYNIPIFNLGTNFDEDALYGLMGI